MKSLAFCLPGSVNVPARAARFALLRGSVFLCAALLSWSGRAAVDNGGSTNAGPASPAELVPGSNKPRYTKVSVSMHEPRLITVKFREGLNVRLRNNQLVSTDATLFDSSRALFDQLATGQWLRADAVSEEQLDEWRERAQRNTGRPMPDLNLQFNLIVPAELDPATVIDSLNALDMVELAQPVPRPASLPTAPDFEPTQTNLFPAPPGMNVVSAWSNNNFGAGIRVVDLEYSFNSLHLDLPAIVNLDALATDPFTNHNHGTAVFGEMAALRDGIGSSGICTGAQYFFSGTYFPTGLNIPSAITTALTVLTNGDVMVIEQQMFGPATTNFATDFGYIPVEWFKPNYDRILVAVGLGVVVVEAAGNGYQNLDDPIYSTGNAGHWPFIASSNSGAILVGAGCSPGGYSTARSRLYFSNFGSRVDLQGWGENVITTGYGDLYSAGLPDPTNEWYTAVFAGTSSASPMVAGACVLVQSAYKAANTNVLTPAEIKAVLQITGSPQRNGTFPASQNIGPLPNIPAALAQAFGTEFFKSSSSDPLEQGTSWIGGQAPTHGDLATFDIPLLLGASSFSASTNVSWRGIRVVDPGLPPASLFINTASWTNTLGSAGIDLSSTSHGLQLSGYLDLDGDQTWNVGAAVILADQSLAGEGAGRLTKSGPGLLRLEYAGSYDDSHINDAATLGLAGGTVALAGGTHAEIVDSTTVASGASRVQRVGGSATLVLNEITREVGGTVDFGPGSPAVAQTSNANDLSAGGGILGGWAIVGPDWAQVTAGGGNQDIVMFPSIGYSPDFEETNNVNLTTSIALTNTSGLAINSLRFGADATLTIGAAGNYSLTNLSGGILAVAPLAAIVSSGADGTLSGPAGGDLVFHVIGGILSNQIVILDNNGSGLTKSGLGTLILDSGANNTYTGPTTINEGILTTGSTINRRYVSTRLLINAGGTYRHGNADNNLRGVTITLDGGTLDLNSRTDFCNTLALGNHGLITGFAGGKTLFLTNAIVPVDARSGIIDAALNVTGGLTKTTDGRVLFRRSGTLLGRTKILAGVVQAGSNITVTTPWLELGSGISSGRLVLGETNGFGGGSPGFASLTSANLVITNGPGLANAIVSGHGNIGQFSALILNFSGATNFNVSLLGGLLPDENYLGLNKSGLGELTLTGAGNYYGFTSNNVGTGTLKIGSTNAIPSGTSPVQKGYVAITSGTFDLNGFDLGIAGLFGAGTVTSSVGGPSITLTFRESGNGTFNGRINNGVTGISVVQNGTGLQTFGGSNTYTGTTTINSGSIGVAGSGVIGNGTGTIYLAGGNLNLSGSRDFSLPISNPVTLTTNGAITSPGGAFILSGLLGGSAGTLTVRYEGLPGGGLYAAFTAPFTFNRPIVIDNGTGVITYFVSGNSNGTVQTYNGNISGSGDFHRGVDGQPQMGGGTTILNGNNSYLGQTWVYDGNLVVNGIVSNGWFIVNSNATLSGNGTLQASVQVTPGATLSPGTSIGTLKMNYGYLSLYPGSTTLMEVNGSTNDFISGLSYLDFAGTLVVSNLGPALVAGQSFHLFSATNYLTGFGGMFENIVPPAPGPGLVWDTSNLRTNGILRVVAAPHFDGTILSGTNLVLSGSGGVTNGSYYVLTSTNVTLPVTNWAFLATNAFDGSGNFVFTNGVSPGIPQRFFLIRLP